MSNRPHPMTTQGGLPPCMDPHSFEAYLEVMHFNLEATNTKSDDYLRDTIVVFELIVKTSSFMSNITIGFLTELSFLALNK